MEATFEDTVSDSGNSALWPRENFSIPFYFSFSQQPRLFSPCIESVLPLKHVGSGGRRCYLEFLKGWDRTNDEQTWGRPLLRAIHAALHARFLSYGLYWNPTPFFIIETFTTIALWAKPTLSAWMLEVGSHSSCWMNTALSIIGATLGGGLLYDHLRVYLREHLTGVRDVSKAAVLFVERASRHPKDIWTTHYCNIMLKNGDGSLQRLLMWTTFFAMLIDTGSAGRLKKVTGMCMTCTLSV